jgi:hypothetical protein
MPRFPRPYLPPVTLLSFPSYLGAARGGRLCTECTGCITLASGFSFVIRPMILGVGGLSPRTDSAVARRPSGANTLWSSYS